ncbi:c-type cytochrome [Boseaceae bacterium BT-24-1]|nr:c-type cytochrome [Boseaceae bacterium BT-24-1]
MPPASVDRAPLRRRAPACRPTAIAVLGFCGLATLAPLAAQDIDPAKARAQFLSSCGVCHTAEKGGANRQGPNLHDVVGKPAAARGDFKFSEPLKSSGLVWDEATLDRWIEDAAAMRPGTTMAYRQRDAERRKLVIAYLKTLAEPK